MDGKGEMNDDQKALEVLKILIEDERHYRAMVQTRLSFHTGMVLALIGLVGALFLRAENALDFFGIGLFGPLIAWIASGASGSIRRLYTHFLETIRAREEIEAVLGIRNIRLERTRQRATADDILPVGSAPKEEKYWPYKELFCGSWLPTDRTPGYFSRTQKLFGRFRWIGWGILVLLWAIALGRSLTG